MKFSHSYLLTVATLLLSAHARPAVETEVPTQTPAGSSLTVLPRMARLTNALEKRQSGPTPGETQPEQIVYEAQAENSHFEVGQLAAVELNKLLDDERCRTSQEGCTIPVKETLDRLASGGKYFERRAVEGKFETRQAGVIVATVVGIWAYLAYKVSHEPEPKLLEVTWKDGDLVEVHRPIAVDIPYSEYKPADVSNAETGNEVGRDRFVFIKASIATDAKACTSLSEAIGATVTPRPVKANLISFDQAANLPGYFLVELTPDQETEAKNLDGVDNVVGTLESQGREQSVKDKQKPDLCPLLRPVKVALHLGRTIFKSAGPVNLREIFVPAMRLRRGRRKCRARRAGTGITTRKATAIPSTWWTTDPRRTT